jgi:hypothetical protein
METIRLVVDGSSGFPEEEPAFARALQRGFDLHKRKMHDYGAMNIAIPGITFGPGPHVGQDQTSDPSADPETRKRGRGSGPGHVPGHCRLRDHRPAGAYRRVAVYQTHSPGGLQ